MFNANEAGVIVLNPSLDQVLLVTDKDDILRFPKREKDRGDTLYRCAFKALKEETGVEIYQLKFLDTGFLFVGEIPYLVAKTSAEITGFSFNIEEIRDVQFYDVVDIKTTMGSQAYKMLNDELSRGSFVDSATFIGNYI